MGLGVLPAHAAYRTGSRNNMPGLLNTPKRTPQKAVLFAAGRPPGQPSAGRAFSFLAPLFLALGMTTSAAAKQQDAVGTVPQDLSTVAACSDKPVEPAAMKSGKGLAHWCKTKDGAVIGTDTGILFAPVVDKEMYVPVLNGDPYDSETQTALFHVKVQAHLLPESMPVTFAQLAAESAAEQLYDKAGNPWHLRFISSNAGYNSFQLLDYLVETILPLRIYLRRYLESLTERDQQILFSEGTSPEKTKLLQQVARKMLSGGFQIAPAPNPQWVMQGLSTYAQQLGFTGLTVEITPVDPEKTGT